MRDDAGSAVFWEAVSTDAFGQVQDETFGNGVRTITDFDPASGRMEVRQTGLGGGSGLINAATSWDLNGNLSARQDLNQSLTGPSPMTASTGWTAASVTASPTST